MDIQDSANGFLCGSISYNGCGPLEAAGLWELAAQAATSNGWGTDKIAAMTLSQAGRPWGKSYVQQLNVLYSGYFKNVYPAAWAVHDYDDPTAGGVGDLLAFERMLSLNSKKAAKVWVTESGNWLWDTDQTDQNVPTKPPCKGDKEPGGTPDPSPDQSHVLACLIDNQPTKQRAGATAWKRLDQVGSGRAMTTEVYWFEFKPIDGYDLNTERGGWDSGLLDQNGKPRASFCALVSGAGPCNGNPDEWRRAGWH